MGSKIIKDKQGFTLVELLLAVAFFSFILLFISAGFVALNRQFVKGRATRDVQHDARFVIEDITRALRSANFGELKSSAQIQDDTFMCFGSAQYTWTTLTADNDGLGQQFYQDTGEKINLAKTTYDGQDCLTDNVRTSNSTEMINTNSVVQFLDIDSYGQIPGVYKILLVLSTRQDEIIGTNGEDANCATLNESGSVSPEYCSVVKFETVVNIRR